MTRQAEQEALWQLKDRSFSQVTREPGVSYTSLRRLLEREIDGETVISLPEGEDIFLASMSIASSIRNLYISLPRLERGGC